MTNLPQRPEIHAPRWNITTHRGDLSSPGYWFLAPYETLATHSEFNGYGWVGPHIYDSSNGELVWSGSGEFDGANILDFRINNVAGENMITLGDRDQGTGIILDDAFEIKQVVQMEEGKGQINGHEFHFVDNGTRALFMKNNRKAATSKAAKGVGYHGKEPCLVNFNSWVELDAVTFEETFAFDTFDHIDISESTYTGGGPDHFCNSGGLGWDFIHTNSVDKNEDGDYILSGRHTNTLYKISGKNGTVIWRLEGYRGKSDFKMVDLKFSRQHHVRWRGRNETHRFVSFLDNAWGEDSQKPSHPHSRGLLVALDEKNMVASIETEIDHPNGNGGYAKKRGDMQILDNGNIFMGWSNLAHHSEHTPDGELIMDAVLQAEWLGSYRNYKFPFVGRPKTTPAIHTAAYGSENDTVDTVVHASWNGATEVSAWNLYRTGSDGEHAELVASANKTGFETRIQYDGYASFVYVEALDKYGVALGYTDVHKTITHPNVTAVAIEQEQAWLKETDADLAPVLFGRPVNMFLIGFAAGMTVLAVVWLAVSQAKRWRGKRRQVEYEPVAESKFELGDDEDDTMVEGSFYDQDEELRKSKVSNVGEGQEQEKLLKGGLHVP